MSHINLNDYNKGFNNLGNTCYLNSGLQLIINNKELCYLIVNSSNPKLAELSEFIIEYYNKNTNSSMSPEFIKNIVSKNNSEFIGFKQNDSFEFIIYFLDWILKNIKINPYEIVTNISIKCKLLKCLNISSHMEKNNFLLLDINSDTSSLDDCYRLYKTREKLCDDNLYFCEKCNDKRIASKRLEIFTWPKHLIVVLKRFYHNGRSSKINKEIEVPTEWRHGYELNGIVYHSGSSTGGHYIYIGKPQDKWLMFNDNYVSPLYDNQLDNYKNYGYIFYFIKK